jgi:rubrerythrin
MYPQFQIKAELEGHSHWLSEIKDQIAESKEHAEQFQQVLLKAQKRFKALKAVEERHANAYKQVLEKL